MFDTDLVYDYKGLKQVGDVSISEYDLGVDKRARKFGFDLGLYKLVESC